MLEIKTKTYASSKYLCSDLNRHPEWQIVSLTDSVKPLRNPQIINGEIVDCEHYFTLFYKSDDCDEDETIPAEDAVWGLVGERKKDNDHSLKHKTFDVSDRLCEAINQHPDWQIVQIVSKDGYLDLFYRIEDKDNEATSAESEKSTNKPLSQDEMSEILDDKQYQYIISVLDGGQTKFVKNLKYSYDNKIAEYDFCYSVDDADRFCYGDAVNIKKRLIKSYSLNNELPNIRSRKVDILGVCNEQDSSD